ncbi:DUF3524 domain-containing protein [Balneolaceae bacterium ANBcel3]|nr:DUF3524 domain-containing protein [Balneolaceae bacterium ANBcel3]
MPKLKARSVPEVWLLSSYQTDSHKIWTRWLLSEFDDINWKLMELSGRRFRWRIRGNPVSWLNKLPDSVPDVIIATSMVDIATIKGLHPRLAEIPVWYYFHENQFAYPLSEHQANQVDPQMVQLYGALASDRLFFNSEFNRVSFLNGVFKLLRTKPQAETLEIKLLLESKSEVLPIPVQPIDAVEPKEEVSILWNHRWEYDKAPEVFTEAILRLEKKQIPFKLMLLGSRSDTHTDPSLLLLREELPERILSDGCLSRSSYETMVGRSSIAVSTAIHEFQGFSMLEATSAGACPLVPDHLCYPEIYPEEYRYPPGDAKELANRLALWLLGGKPEPPDVSYWTSGPVKKKWDRLIEKIHHES